MGGGVASWERWTRGTRAPPGNTAQGVLLAVLRLTRPVWAGELFVFVLPEEGIERTGGLVGGTGE